MALIGRIIVICFAVAVSSLAAGMAIAMGLLGPQWHAFSGDVGERFVFWGTASSAPPSPAPSACCRWRS